MEKVISRRHPVKFYGLLVLLYILTTAIALVLINEGALENGKQSKLLIPLGLLLFSIYCTIQYRINTPAITITHNSISFDRKKYSIDNIKSIEFTGKQRFKNIISYPMEAVTIVFNDTSVRYIYDDVYNNSAVMKRFLDFQLNNTELAVVNNTYNISNEHLYYYKGYFFFCGRVLFFFFFVTFFILIFLKEESSAFLVLFGILLIGLVMASQLNFFALNEKFFVINNYFKFWKKKVYRISDIKEIIYESHGKAPNGLRIITKDYQSKLYQAATLTDHDWLELKDDLEREKIFVRMNVYKI